MISYKFVPVSNGGQSINTPYLPLTERKSAKLGRSMASGDEVDNFNSEDWRPTIAYPEAEEGSLRNGACSWSVEN